MTQAIQRFLSSERAQDLVEYSLLLAMVVLASAGLVIGLGQSIEGIWNTTNTNLQAANTVAS